MSVAELPAPAIVAMRGQENYGQWLGVTQVEDGAESIASLGDAQPEWLVVDHYGLDAQWERVLRPHAQQVAVIDDLANRPHECNLLLDQNLCERERYIDWVPAECELVLGPRYALLREEYSQHRRVAARAVKAMERVFIFFGGSDPCNLTGIALEALSHPRLRHLRVDVVVGANNPHFERLRRQAEARVGTAVHGPRKHLADLMVAADLAIGAAGTTTWERMCLGLPSIVVSIAENQRPIAESLAQDGLIQYVGTTAEVGVAELIAAVERAADGGQDLSQQSLRGRLMVDGLGAMRVAECMDATKTEELQLRAAGPQDAELFFGWVNDRQVRLQSLNTAAIPWVGHRDWFDAKIKDSRSQLFVLEAKGLPVGQIRFDNIGAEVRINYSVDALFRGRGWGRRLVALGMRQLSEQGRVIFRAEVKASNRASRATFVRLGFQELAPEERRDELKIFRFDTATQTPPKTN
jgi:UDP-2,4-diacetamido-2,4,6-trideoxy-beta-L-altropyranose hydrolase